MCLPRIAFAPSHSEGPRISSLMQADLGIPPAEAGTMSRADSSAMSAYRFNAQSGLTGELRPPSRKELAYLGHLDRVHQ